MKISILYLIHKILIFPNRLWKNKTNYFDSWFSVLHTKIANYANHEQL